MDFDAILPALGPASPVDPAAAHDAPTDAAGADPFEHLVADALALLHEIAPHDDTLLPPTQALTQGFVFAEPEAPPALPTLPTSPASTASGASGASPATTATRPATPEAPQTRQGLVIGGLRLMVGYADGRELTDLPPLCTLPHAPAWFAGMANLHGSLVPVFDLARWHGVESPAPHRMLLVLAHDGEAAGLLIDGLPRRLRFTPTAASTAEACAPSALQPFVRSTHLIDDTIWFDIDVQALMACIEQRLAVAA